MLTTNSFSECPSSQADAYGHPSLQHMHLGASLDLCMLVLKISPILNSKLGVQKGVSLSVQWLLLCELTFL